MKRIKKLILWGCIGGIVYALLSYHIIFIGKTPKLLKKSKMTFEYTFFSTQGKSVESILSVDELRNDGVGELLLQMGMTTEKELERLTAKIEEKRRGGS